VICTGSIDADGVLICSELVTKCPSKYEDSTGALSVAQLLAYGEQIVDKPVKVTGTVQAGTLGPVGRESRFALAGVEGSAALPVSFDGALPDELGDGSLVVVTGSLDAAGSFVASDVALGE
jgi:cytochrome c-type biogenesis protein CcmE